MWQRIWVFAGEAGRGTQSSGSSEIKLWFKIKIRCKTELIAID
jgi:hypothetical protein